MALSRCCLILAAFFLLSALIRLRIAFLRAGLDFTDLSVQAYRLLAAAKSNQPVDKAAARQLLDRRWQLMRHLYVEQHLAVNMAAVAACEKGTWQPLGWTGPSDAVLKNWSRRTPMMRLNSTKWMNRLASPVRPEQSGFSGSFTRD